MGYLFIFLFFFMCASLITGDVGGAIFGIGVIGITAFALVSMATEAGVVPLLFLLVFLPAIYYGFRHGAKENAAERAREAEDRAVDEEQRRTGRKVQRLGACPWCGEEVRAIVEAEHLLSRDDGRCPACGKKVLKCRRCEDYAKGGWLWDDELCPRCEQSDRDVAARRREADEDERLGGLEGQRLGLCPWCGQKVRAVIEQEMNFFRDQSRCPRCRKKTVKCKRCENYAKRSWLGEEDLCPQCQASAPSRY